MSVGPSSRARSRFQLWVRLFLTLRHAPFLLLSAAALGFLSSVTPLILTLVELMLPPFASRVDNNQNDARISRRIIIISEQILLFCITRSCVHYSSSPKNA